MDQLLETPVGRKPIPPTRDRLQSQWLTRIVGCLLLLLTLDTLAMSRSGAAADSLLWPALAISLTFALIVWALKAGTPAAAAIGGLICLLITYWTFSRPESPIYSGLAPLITLFVLTFLATRAGKRRKLAAGLAEELSESGGRRGRRASQVIANLGAAGLLSSSAGIALLELLARHPSLNTAADRIQVLVLAALAEATADTVSSEIGQAFGGMPFLLTTLRRVPPGTDGAITLTGSAAGILASLLVVLTGGWSMHLAPPSSRHRPHRRPRRPLLR